jgi:hypothetical protein
MSIQSNQIPFNNQLDQQQSISTLHLNDNPSTLSQFHDPANHSMVIPDLQENMQYR